MNNKYIKNLIFSLIFFTISILGFLYIVRAINNNNKSFSIEKEELIKAEVSRQEIQKINQNIDSIAVQADELDKHFLKSNDAGIFLDELEKEGEINNVSVEILSVKQTDKELGLNLKAIGSFNNLNKFLFTLENYKYELEIVSYKLQRLSSLEEENLPEWRSDIEIKLVSFIEN